MKMRIPPREECLPIDGIDEKRYLSDVLHMWRIQDACVFLAISGVAVTVVHAMIPKDWITSHVSEMQSLSWPFHLFLAFWSLCAAVVLMVFLFGALYKTGHDIAAKRVKMCLPLIRDYFLWGRDEAECS